MYIISNQAQKCHPTSAASSLGAHHPVCAQASIQQIPPHLFNTSSAQLVTAVYYIFWYLKSTFEKNVKTGMGQKLTVR